MISVLGSGICRSCRAASATMFAIRLADETILKWVLCIACDMRRA